MVSKARTVRQGTTIIELDQSKKTDEITFTVPRELHERMVERWPESFLATKAWQTVKKKIIKSRKVWGDGE
jgi:hypothetical protein